MVALKPTPIQCNELPASGGASQIAEFFEGKCIFVTGATGFIGKLLVEKLLRSCPGIKKIYLLVREKKGQHVQERVDHVLQSKAFDYIREKNPQNLDKVVAVAGDLTLPNLGISFEDEQSLIRDVSVVFHSAATVKFDEPLKNAINMNVTGTLSVVNLSKKFHDLKAFVHVSTAYCNCDRKVIEEKIYPTEHDPEKVVEMNSWLADDAMNNLSESLRGKKPNTYTYTKALTEALLGKVGAGMPIAIFRPTIVANAYNEPYPAWVDSANGCGGLMVAVANGVWRYSNTVPGAIADIVPADFCINAMISLAWNLANSTRTQEIGVYNFSCGKKALSWEKAMGLVCTSARSDSCFETTLWYPSHSQYTDSRIFKLRTLLGEALPAYVIDVFLKVLGKRPMAKRLYEKIQRNAAELQYFMNGTWEFKTMNVKELWHKLNREDKKTFGFDIEDLDVEKFVYSGLFGVRTYYLKNDPKTVASSHKRIQ
ncbi:unnamed protein product, partial [Notodromas monacha]